MSPGLPLIHDLERAHNALVRDDGLESEAHRTDINDPVDLEWIEVANNLCSRLKCYLWRFTGMLLQNIQARDRWDQIARVVRHYLIADRTYPRLR